MKALVIGGGVAGSVTAMALRKAGIDAAIFEAYDWTADGVGAYLTLAVNGMRTLDSVGLKEVVSDRGFDTPRMAFYLGNGKKIGESTAGEASDAVNQTMRRADLYAALRDEAVRRGVQIEYGRRLVSAERSGAQIVARFADSTEATGDLLVGADGLHSQVRMIIDPDAPRARYVGLLNTGGFADGVEIDGPPGVMHMVFGKRCFFCYLKAPDGSVWWFSNPPSPVEPDASLSDLDGERWRDELLRMVSVDRTPAADIVQATSRLFAPWATYDYPTVPTWHRDRMVIIGDAAHATSPSAGQGASMAIEDGVTLAKCLRDAPDVDEALRYFDAQRRQRVEAVVAQGKRNGDNKAPGPVMRLVRDFFVARAFRTMTATGADPNRWMWDHRIDWDTPVTPSSPTSA